ncbi:MAG: dephospho-CoA kinase [bacterium]|nr:dephospho-CoA kinase [bacterium]
MIIGICGKIASGKSEVLKVLAKRGYYCIDADDIVHSLYKKGGVGAKKVSAYFGRKFLNKDGSVNRAKLRDEVFMNDDERKYLENLIHPEVYGEIELLLKRTRKRKIAIEAVYFDVDFLNDFVDELWWVERPREDILKVLVEERGFDSELAEKVIDLIEKPEKVDLVIENDGYTLMMINKKTPDD